MHIKYVRKMETVREVRDQILSSPVQGHDVETTELDALKGELRLLQVSTTPTEAVVFDFRHLDARHDDFNFLRDIYANPKVVKMFHNAKFDMRWIKRHLGVETVETSYDSYLASQLIACGDDSELHNLRSVAARVAHIELDKTEQKSDWSQNELSDDQLRYAANDSFVLHAVREAQSKILSSQNLERVALIEFDAIDSVSSLENNGFYMRWAEWRSRVVRQVQEKDIAAYKLHQEFSTVSTQQSMFGGSEFNLESFDDQAEALKRLGIPVEDSTVEHKIQGFAEKWPIINVLLEFRGLCTALRTFGPDYERFIHPNTGRIHADFKQIATPTGRFSCSDPNLQQIPQEKEYRNCFRAPNPSRKLVKADYSQIELRIMAQFSRDPILVDAYNRDADLHAVTACRVFNTPMSEVGTTMYEGKPMRHIGKGLNFGTAYDIGATRFSQNSGLSVDESKRVLAQFWEVYKTLNVFLKGCAERAVEEMEARTWSGRTWRFWYDAVDQKAISQVGRLGRNMPIQGTCSDIMKMALYLLTKALREHSVRTGNLAFIVNIVHDEIIVECSALDADVVKAIVEAKMIEAGERVLTVVPCKVDAEICDMWSK